MVYSRPQLRRGQVLDHGSSRSGRWLRQRRIKIAFWIAVVEGILVAFKFVSWWVAIPIAAVSIAFYLYAGRDLRSDAGRQIAWIAAASQALVALVPVLVVVVGTLAVIFVAVLAVVALVVLFTER